MAAMKEKAEKMRAMILAAKQKAAEERRRKMTTQAGIAELLVKKTEANIKEEESIAEVSKVFCVELATVYASDNVESVSKNYKSAKEIGGTLVSAGRNVDIAYNLAKQLQILSWKDLAAAQKALSDKQELMKSTHWADKAF